MSILISSTLSVSRRKKLDCVELADYLESLGISSLVNSNISTMQDGPGWPHKEYGCQLTQGIKTRKDIEKIWNPIRERYGFTCAHVKVANLFDGCVLDFLAPSNCGK